MAVVPMFAESVCVIAWPFTVGAWGIVTLTHSKLADWRLGLPLG